MLYQIFCDALAVEESARNAFIESACKGDNSLITQIKSMLAEDRNSSKNAQATWSALGRKSSTAVSEQFIGSTINSFKIVALIGQGGMGHVYLAERLDKKFEQKVAIKIIHTYFDEMIGKQPLIREASLMARLNHPNIGKIFDAGVSDSGFSYIVMEYIEGLDFDDYLAQKHILISDALGLFIDLCSAIQHAHQHQVVHADLKPENILVDLYQQIKVLDFGVSRLFSSRESKNSPILVDYLKGMTKKFAAPEQLQGKGASVLTDIYALGKIFSLIVERFTENCTNNAHKELKSIVNKAMSLAANQRYSSVDLLRNDVIRFQQKKIPTSFECSRWYGWQKQCLVRYPYLFTFILVSLIATVLFITQLVQQNAQIAQEKAQSDAVVEGVENILRLSNREKLKSNTLSAGTFLEDSYHILNNNTEVDKEAKSRVALILAESLLSQSKEKLAEQIYIDTINDTLQLPDKKLVIKAGIGLAKMYRTTVAYIPSGTVPLEKIFPFINLQQPESVEHALFYLEYLRIKAMETDDDDDFVREEQRIITYIRRTFFDQLTIDEQLDINLKQIKNDFYRLSSGGNVIFEGVEQKEFNKHYKPIILQGLQLLNNSMDKISSDDLVQIAEFTLWQARLTYELEGMIPAEQLALRAITLYKQSLGERHPKTIRAYFVLFLITELEQPVKAFNYIKQAKLYIGTDSSQLLSWSRLYIDILITTGEYKLFQEATYIIQHYLSENIEEFSLVIPGYLYDYIDYFDFVPAESVALLFTKNLREKLINSTQTAYYDELNQKVILYAKSGNIIKTRIAEIEAMMNSELVDKLGEATKLHYAWLLSVSGDTEGALNYLISLQPITYSERENNYSHYLFFQRLQKARIYLNANQLNNASKEIMAAEVILNNLSLLSKNGKYAELLVLKSELAYQQGDIALAKQYYTEAKPIVELQFPEKSWLAEHVNTLKKQFNF